MALPVSAVLLDTCVVITLAVEGAQKINKRVLSILDHPGTKRFVSSLSVQEVAQKVNRGKLQMDSRAFADTLADLNARILPFTAEHAQRLFGLPLHHSDPIDRMLICTALAENLPIMTSDREFSRYEGVRIIRL